MEQHPIPQQISSYQFKLVGDMTLKQFFQVAGGALVGLIIYSTGLHPIIKWPLILIAVGLGAAMAFLPFEERPLEKWIIAFFRSIYSPTIYKWKKSEAEPIYFAQPKTTTPTIEASDEYLSSVPQDKQHKSLDSAEQNFLSKFTSLWGGMGTSTKKVFPTKDTSALEPLDMNPKPVKKVIEKTPLTVPKSKPTNIERTIPKLVVEEKPKPVDTTTEAVAERVGEGEKTEKISGKQAVFSIDAAPPNPPTIPNTVTGQVIDQGRKIVANAIMEIRDKDGRPVRAFKSNMAGHFIIVTSLLNGTYEIKTEKEGYRFDPVTFEAEGEIIPPIAIKGNKILEGGENENQTAK